MPRSRPYQTLLPCASLGPSQILLMAEASIGFRQFASDDDPPNALHIANFALYVHARGSWMSPSVMPSKRIACRDRRVVRHSEFGRRNGPAEQLVHHHLRPKLRGDEAIPVIGIGPGKNPVIEIWKVLRQIVALVTSGRATHPVIAGGRRAVVGLRQLYPPQVLLANAVVSEILDQSIVKRAVRD